MKVTDTHDTAAEHFDYLEADTLQEVARDDARRNTQDHDSEQAELLEQAELADLADLVEATGPVHTGTPHLTAHTA